MSKPSGRDGNEQRARVLVVDDDDAMCELLRQVLSDKGYAVATVPHGAAALELVKHHRPAVMLVDLRMPIMDGWAFVEQYRRVNKPPASIILLSGIKDLEAIATQLGCDAYLRKPFDIDDVTAAVERLIARA